MVNTSLLSFVAAGALVAALPAQSQELAEGWDFVPGEKLLMFDDFTDMAKGGAPPHWKVRGATVKLGANGRLIVSQDTTMYPNVAAWPNNFTIEQDFTVETNDSSDLTWEFQNADGEWNWRFWMRFNNEEQSCEVHLDTSDDALGSAQCKYATGQANKLGVWVQDGRIRLYFNKERLIDVNQVKTAFQIASVRFEPGEGGTLTLGPSRIAESSPDVGQTIMASGRYVTHGIQFDTNSDKLRPESGPVLKLIADALAKQPALKLRIEGHTDSTGDAAANLDLSKRRAESVKNALVSQYGIAADRLATEGFGQTRPVSGNDTPRGRADNRRVEFVKM